MSLSYSDKRERKLRHVIIGIERAIEQRGTRAIGSGFLAGPDERKRLRAAQGDRGGGDGGAGTPDRYHSRKGLGAV